MSFACILIALVLAFVNLTDLAAYWQIPVAVILICLAGLASYVEIR